MLSEFSFEVAYLLFISACQFSEQDPATHSTVLGAVAKPRRRQRLLSASLILFTPASQLPRRLDCCVKIASP